MSDIYIFRSNNIATPIPVDIRPGTGGAPIASAAFTTIQTGSNPIMGTTSPLEITGTTLAISKNNSDQWVISGGAGAVNGVYTRAIGASTRSPYDANFA